MIDNEIIFLKQIKSINHKILGGGHYSNLISDIDAVFNFLGRKLNNDDLYLYYEKIIDLGLSEKVVCNEDYANYFSLYILNKCFSLLKINSDDFWAFIFSKLTGFQDYSGNFFIHKLIINSLIELDSFPLNKDLDLHDILNFLKNDLANTIKTSSSYTLYYDAVMRSGVVLEFWNFLQTNNEISVWFPFAGIGIEPILILFTLYLLFDANKPENKNQKKVTFYLSDYNCRLLEMSVKELGYREVLQKLKKEFCLRQNIDEKMIKTRIKDVLKNVFIIKNDFIVSNKIIDKKCDFILINSYKLNDYGLYKNKILKLLNKLKTSTTIITEFDKTSSNNFDLNNSLLSKVIESSSSVNNLYIYRKNVEHISDKVQEKDEITTLKQLVLQWEDLSQKDLKKNLLRLNRKTIVSEKDFLIYADLLLKAGFLSRSFDILKKYYKSDYNKSYNLLIDICKLSKNMKLVNKVNAFIEENHIKEKGFSIDLLDAISDGIDDYFKNNKKSILKDKDWL